MDQAQISRSGECFMLRTIGVHKFNFNVPSLEHAKKTMRRQASNTDLTELARTCKLPEAWPHWLAILV
jgi:hypothetical protein